MLYITVNDSTRKILDKKVLNNNYLKLAPGIYYSGESNDMLKEIKNKLNEIFNRLKINGIISYNSSIDYSENNIWIASTKERIIDLGQLKINVFKANDRELNINFCDSINESLKVVNPYVMLLQNHSLRKVDQKRINPTKAVEKFLIYIIENNSVDFYEQNLFNIAKSTGYLKEFEIANDAIKLNLKTQNQTKTQNIDQQRVLMFNNLSTHLNNISFELFTHNFNNQNTIKLAFFESYFSNYIEGTEFEVNEAYNIVFNNQKYQRHKDGNDIIKTFNLIVDNINNPKNINTTKEFISILKQWHNELFEHRKNDILVGEFKIYKNKAGGTHFVSPQKVEQTLIEAFEISKKIENPLAKAIYFKTIISEIHPFEDGNGRISRILMNNYLSLNNNLRIIVPTVFRDDYILGLKAFSQGKKVDSICKVMNKAYKITNQIPWDKNTNELITYLYENSAFEEPKDAIWGTHPTNFYYTQQESTLNSIKTLKIK